LPQQSDCFDAELLSDVLQQTGCLWVDDRRILIPKASHQPLQAHQLLLREQLTGDFVHPASLPNAVGQHGHALVQPDRTDAPRIHGDYVEDLMYRTRTPCWRDGQHDHV
jgi:hypothetical protein